MALPFWKLEIKMQFLCLWFFSNEHGKTCLFLWAEVSYFFCKMEEAHCTICYLLWQCHLKNFIRVGWNSRVSFLEFVFILAIFGQKKKSNKTSLVLSDCSHGAYQAWRGKWFQKEHLEKTTSPFHGVQCSSLWEVELFFKAGQGKKEIRVFIHVLYSWFWRCK